MSTDFPLFGEFHYFRVQRPNWQERLAHVRDMGLDGVSIYIPWNWHAPDPEKLDFTGGEIAERDLRGALEEIADAGLKCVFRPGPFITAEWRNGGMPDWLWEQSPEMLALDSRGRPSGDNHAYPAITYPHPAYEREVNRWMEAVLGLAAPFAKEDGPIVNLQLDDEPSYWQQLSDPLAIDYNPLLIGTENGVSRYGAWLLGRHQTLDGVNASHGKSYDQPEEIDPPREPMSERSQLQRYVDWLDFKLSLIDEHVVFLLDSVKRAGWQVPVSMLFPYLIPLQAAKFAEFQREHDLPLELTNECYLSLFSTSQSTEEKLGSVVTCHETYHMWRRGTPGPPMTMELQGSNSSYITPQAMETLYALTVARGIKGINFYMFVGGENPPGFDNVTGKTYDVSAPIALDNSERPHGAVIRKLAKVTSSVGEGLRSSEPLRDVMLGWYVPYESAILVADDAAMPDVTKLLNMFNTGDFGLSDAMSLQALMVLSSVSFGCVDLERDEDLLADIRQLWVGTADFMSQEVQERLARYVRAGGHLVLLPTIPRTDDAMQPCGVLLDLVFGDGVRPTFPDPEPHAPLLVETIEGRGGEILIAPGPVTTFELPVGAEPVAWLAEGHVPCAFTLPVGGGRVTMIGFQLRYMPTESPDQKNFLVDLVEGDGHRRYAWTDNHQLTAMQLGSSGDGFLCVINPVDIPASTKVTYSTPAGERASFPLVLGGIGFAGRDARLLPVSLDLGSGIELRHSTWELIGRDHKDNASELSFFDPGGGKGEVAFKSERPLQIRCHGGRILPNATGGEGMTVVVIEPQEEVVRLQVELSETNEAEV